MAPLSNEEILRKALFIPCDTKADLQQWIQVYLGLELPDGIIDPSSTSSPAGFLFEVYDDMRFNRGKYSQILSYASRDSMKCVERGTRILTRDRGLVCIEDVVIGDVIWSGLAWRPVTQWIHEGEKAAVALELEDGHKLTVSPIHRVWAWSAGSEPTWKRVSELDLESDFVMVDSGEGRVSVQEDSDDYRTGYVLGILAGDGCCTVMDSYGKVCVSASDPVVQVAWANFCMSTCGRVPKPPCKERPWDYWISSVEVVKRLHSLGVDPSYAHEKRAPHAAMSSFSSMAGFLSGLLDTDGTVAKNNLDIPSTSLGLLQDCQLMLNALGAHSYVRSSCRIYLNQKHKIHHLIIKARQFPELERVGVRILAKKAQAIRVRLAKTKDTHDGILYSFIKPLLDKLPSLGGRGVISHSRKPVVSPKYRTVCREKLDSLLDWAEAHDHLSTEELARWRLIARARWVKPVSVLPCVADLYDLTVNVDRSYWSNGLVSHNTLGATILEILTMLHLQRNVGHMAAVEAQARRAQIYMKQFFSRPILRDFVTSKNERTIEISRYYNPRTGDSFTVKAAEALPQAERDRLEYISNSTTIVICTVTGANSLHVPLLIIDEVDIVENPDAYEEARFIPSAYDGNLPITVLTSTRKYAFGLVQKEILNAEKTGLEIRHWNILDCTQRCPPEWHLPDRKRLPIFRSDDTLDALSAHQFLDLDSEAQKLYVKDEGWEGCLTKCKLFAVPGPASQPDLDGEDAEGHQLRTEPLSRGPG